MLEDLRSPNLLKPTLFELRRAHKASAQLSRIVMEAEVIPTDKPVDQVVYKPKRELQQLQSDVYKQHRYGKEARQFIPRSRVAIAKTAGAAALYYGTAHTYEYRSHRFIFGEAEDLLNYSCVPFDVTVPFFVSRELHLSGLQAIAAEPQALHELTQLAAQLQDTQPDEWGGNHLSRPFEFSA